MFTNLQPRLGSWTRGLFSSVVVVLGASATALWGATYNVAGDFSSIQAAHDAASSGDTILVAPGTYVGPITITKAIVLASHFLPTGDASFIGITILDGGGGSFVIQIPAGAEEPCCSHGPHGQFRAGFRRGPVLATLRTAGHARDGSQR